MKTVKIVLADDHQIVIDGLESIIKSQDNYEIVGFVNNGKDAIQAYKIHQPDVLIMDLDMPVMNGVVAATEIKKDWPESKIIILSLHAERAIIQQLIKVGVDGYLLKNCDKEELFNAIKSVQNGKKFFSADVTMVLSTSLEKEIKISPSDASLLSKLTEREIEVLRAIARGLSNKEISEQLFVSHRTIDTHRQNIMKKLGLRKVVGLIKFAIKIGLVD